MKIFLACDADAGAPMIISIQQAFKFYSLGLKNAFIQLNKVISQVKELSNLMMV